MVGISEQPGGARLVASLLFSPPPGTAPEVDGRVLEWQLRQAAKGRATVTGPIVTIADVRLALVQVSAPMPLDERWVYARAFSWPGAVDACRSHTTHTIVAVMEDCADRLQASRAMTAVVSSIAVTRPDLIAVLWNNLALTPAQMWANRSAFTDTIAALSTVWVTLHPIRSRSDTVVVTSQGLAAYIGRELELEGGGAQDALTAFVLSAANIVAYLLNRGAALADGATVGLNETKRFSVHNRTSAQFAHDPVQYIRVT